MKQFSKLFSRLDATAGTNEKIDALRQYFATTPPEDAVWAAAFLSGRKPRRSVSTSLLWKWTAEQSGLPEWVIAESYHVVGDMAEAISLLLPETDGADDTPLHQIASDLIALYGRDDESKKDYVLQKWAHMDRASVFLFNKLITGSFRVGVSEKLVAKALSLQMDIPENIVVHRLTGRWDPASVSLADLLSESGQDLSRPYPFFLAYPLESDPETLGPVDEWLIERKFDGIRGQIIVREGELFIWSRGEDLLTEKFPEFSSLARLLPSGTVIDGEILPVKNGAVLPFHVMQTRIGRKQLTKKSLAEAPLEMICYDLLEEDGMDIRELPLSERRERLKKLLNGLKAGDSTVPLQLSPALSCTDWDQVVQERASARDTATEGLMLKRKDSIYGTGRRRGPWWKWKIDPLSVDGVLVYAQRGHGRRADLYTDYTLAVWDQGELVPFCKAYSGLTDKELLQVDSWIKKHTLNKFGPVRSVEPELVFEIAFEGIQPSPRHKSGIALRFPRILRWRQDKRAIDANTKEDLLAILQQYAQS